MKTEQEIVLQKKTIIIFSLAIFTIIMGVLNVQKEKIQIAKEEVYDDSINTVCTIYTANEELFRIAVSGELPVKLNVEEFQSGEVVEDKLNKEEEKTINVQKEILEKKEEIKVEQVTSTEDVEIIVAKEETVDNNNVKDASGEHKNVEENTVVASRGSYLRDSSVPPTEYEKVIQVKATAYCLCKKCCGKSPENPRYGYTASGIRIVPGTGMKVIAVDTSVVPLGTNVYVEGLYGAGNYGYAVAGDTGSAIKNNKIDLYMDTHSQALAWGVKTVNLYILGE